ncbi:MAG: MBL fold metallo-hydrolase [Bacteroidetes bacterium]|nr:MBL fold metallo-hydrolase [Bacteroidota bacterium]
MKITFTGTGTSQGVPIIGCTCEVCLSVDLRDKRLRSSVYIEVEGKQLMIDAGPDFRQQCLGLGINRLDGILITHGHKDHVGGIDDIRALNFISGKAVDIYCDQLGDRAIRKEIPYAFEDMKYPGVPEANLISIDDKPFIIDGVGVMPINVLHYKLPVLGFRIRNFTYITDANFISEIEFDKIYGTEILVLNALRYEKHISHFNLEEAIEVGLKSGAKEVYFTHISHQLGLHHQVEPTLPSGFHLAYDGLSLII